MDRFIKTDTECVGAAALAERGANPPKRFKTLRIEGDSGAGVRRGRDEGRRQVGVVDVTRGESPGRHHRAGHPRRRRREDGEKVEVAVGDGTARGQRGAAVDPRPEEGASAGLRGGPAPGLCSLLWVEPLYGVVPNFSEGRRPT